MSHKNTPYPFDNIPDENYFGEFRELLSATGPYEKKDKEKNNHNTDNEKTDDTFNEFSVLPKY